MFWHYLNQFRLLEFGGDPDNREWSFLLNNCQTKNDTNFIPSARSRFSESMNHIIYTYRKIAMATQINLEMPHKNSKLSQNM